MLFTLLPAVLAPLALACASAGRQAAWEVEQAQQAGTATAAAGQSSLIQEGDAHWAKRDDKGETLAAIAAWEKAAAAEPNDGDLMTKLSRAYFFLVDAHVRPEGGSDEEKLGLHQKGVDWGEKALMLLDPGFAQAMRGGADFIDAVKKIGPPAIGATYWYCANLGRFAVIKGLSTRLYYKDRVKTAMERIGELDPKFFYAGADRYFGAFYSVLPSIAGKDLDKSEQHLKKAIEMAPEYLANKLFMAEFLAVERDDRAMYEKLLNEVLAAPDTDNPDIAPENRGLKRVAKVLLSQAGDKF